MKRLRIPSSILAFLLLTMGFVMESEQTTHPLEEKEWNSPQGTWQYAVSNSGQKAMLYIHGANSSRKIWKNQYKLVIPGYKNIFVDLLGYGASDKPISGYSLGNWIEGLHAILEQEGITEVCIVAHSNGVIFAKEFYRNYPGQVSHLVLLDGMLKQLLQGPMLEWMKTALERDDYETFMKNNIEHMPVQGLNEADIDLLKRDALATPKQVRAAELALVSNSNTWEALTISTPITIVHANNPFWTAEYIKDLSAIAPYHDLITWKDAGHFISLQYPERLNQLIHKVSE